MGAKQSVEESETENEEGIEQDGQEDEGSDEVDDEDDMMDGDDEGLQEFDEDVELEQEPEVRPFNQSQTPLQPQRADAPPLSYLFRSADPEMQLADATDLGSPINILPQISRYSRPGEDSRSIPGSPSGGRSRSGSGSDFGMSHQLPLLPSSIPPSPHYRTFAREVITEFHLIRHAESTNNLTTLIGGRSPFVALTPKGKRQAAVLGRFIRDFSGFQFDAYYTSPLERAWATAAAVCKELGVAEERLVVVDALQELSQGEWEGKPRGEIYTPVMVGRMTASQPDFRAPGGESQRQVEARMMEVLMSIVSQAEDTDAQNFNSHPVDVKGPPSPQTRYAAEMDFRFLASPAGSYFAQQRGGDSEMERDSNGNFAWGASTVFRAALFSHGTAIKCLLRGVLGSSPQMTHKLSVDNTSVTVLRHSSACGWHLLKVNDISHLQLARGPSSARKREEV